MKSKIIDYRNMNSEELVNNLSEDLKKVHELIFKKEYGELKDTSLIRKYKSSIAQIKTVLNERDIKV